MDEEIVLEKNKKHSIDIVVDRLVVKDGIESRLADSMETASKWAEGIVVIQEVDGPEHMYSQHFACPDCHISLPRLNHVCSPLTVHLVPAQLVWELALPWK